MQSRPQEVGLITLPFDIICYLALNYLDYTSAVNLLKEIIIKHFSLQNPFTSIEDLFEELKKFRNSSPYNQYQKICKKLFPRIVAGDFTNFYFSSPQGWLVWGNPKHAKQLSGRISDLPQKLNLPLKIFTARLWQKFQLNFVDIVCCYPRTFFLTNDGKVYQSGEDFLNEDLFFTLKLVRELVGQKIIKLALGVDHILALTDKGQVYSWGRNEDGQLGLDHDVHQNVPQLITAFKDIKIIDIFAGYYISFCLSEDGKIYAFGDNKLGQLGLGDMEKITKPELITTLQDKKMVSVACKYQHTLFLSAEGEVFSTGQNENGALGLETFSSSQPLLIKTLGAHTIKMIAVGFSHSVCLDEKGKTYSFGSNRSQQLGVQNFGLKDTTIPQIVSLPEDEIIIEVAAGEFHTLCLTKKGELYSFGSNTHKQLGHVENQPCKVSFPSDSVTINPNLQESSAPAQKSI